VIEAVEKEIYLWSWSQSVASVSTLLEAQAVIFEMKSSSLLAV